MMSLDEEISHLQKENNHVDSQLHRMKSDVTGMETDAASEDKVDIKHLNLREEDTRQFFLFLYMTECCDRQNLCTRKNILISIFQNCDATIEKTLLPPLLTPSKH